MKTAFLRSIAVIMVGVAAWSIYLLMVPDNGAEHKQKDILARIALHEQAIKQYSEMFTVEPRMYVSVIYGELYNNLNIYDEFDETRARLGFDPSIGFSQMRISTALWIENNCMTNAVVTKSRSKKELIDKLTDDTINIAYSVLYVRLISQKVPRKTSSSINTIASYYGRGIDFNKDVSDTLYTNSIGKTAEEFYHSDLLCDIFPRLKKVSQ